MDESARPRGAGLRASATTDVPRILSTRVVIAVGAGITAAEARVVVSQKDDPDATSDAISLTAGGSPVSYTWHWHPTPTGAINADDAWRFDIETRITAGSGTVSVLQPHWAVLRSRIAVDANVTGP